MAKKKKVDEGPVGGIVFFLSLAFLTLLGLMNLILLPRLFFGDAWSRCGLFGVGVFVGFSCAHFFVRGRISVLLHELKHSLLSGFVGNRWKQMAVERDQGHFEYSYSKQTAQYNAFIALAPYFLPVMTILAIGLVCWHPNSTLQLVVIGVGYGLDIWSGLRDVKPWQTDLTSIRGGYKIALTYITAAHLLIFTVLFAWVFQSSLGLRLLVYGWYQIALHIVGFYTKAA